MSIIKIINANCEPKFVIIHKNMVGGILAHEGQNDEYLFSAQINVISGEKIPIGFKRKENLDIFLRKMGEFLISNSISLCINLHEEKITLNNKDNNQEEECCFAHSLLNRIKTDATDAKADIFDSIEIIQ
jgi:hypothetical protein